VTLLFFLNNYFFLKSAIRKTNEIATQNATFSQFCVCTASITATPKNKRKIAVFVPNGRLVIPDAGRNWHPEKTIASTPSAGRVLVRVVDLGDSSADCRNYFGGGTVTSFFFKNQDK